MVNDSDKAPAENPYDVAFYAAKINAWFLTKLELDKSLIALSSAGIAGLIALLTAASQMCAIVLFMAAFAMFVGVILLELIILDTNADYVKCLINKEPPPRYIRSFDIIAKVLFMIAILFVVGIALTFRTEKLNAVSKIREIEHEKCPVVINIGQIIVDSSKTITIKRKD